MRVKFEWFLTQRPNFTSDNFTELTRYESIIFKKSLIEKKIKFLDEKVDFEYFYLKFCSVLIF
jgi:hypothetical protein